MSVRTASGRRVMAARSLPLVSICVPTWNRAPFLKVTLESVLAQDYPRFEVVVSDNCSADDTERVCREFAVADPRVRYVRQSRNLGLHGNHNFLIEASRGDLLCFFHDDDLYDPRIVSEYVAFLAAHPEVGIVGADWNLIDDDGLLIGSRCYDVKPVTPGLQYIERTTRTGRSFLGCPGTMIRRSALGRTRFDEEGTLGFGDFVVWFAIAETHAVGHLTGRLFSYRLHRRSASRRTIESIAQDYDATFSKYFRQHLERWPQHVRLVDRWRSHMRRYLFWALAYELALYYRVTAPGDRRPPRQRTIFETASYRLTPEELQRVLAKLRVYRTGAVQRAALVVIETLVRSHLTRPLAWLSRYPAWARAILGLR